MEETNKTEIANKDQNYYSEIRKHQFLHPLTIPDKEKIYKDLTNIERSWSGRMDTNIGNTFVMEAEQLLVNSMELFEMGYFDCAYYSLRSAIDISTTMVFLTDIPEEEREQYLNKWKNSLDFPLRLHMLNKLSKDGTIFVDMHNHMPTFFQKAQEVSQELNKYVHKQGLSHFYVSRNHPIWGNRSPDKFICDFIEYLSDVIGIVAVMRLAFDPFPILLMDEEILYRCFDSMTDPYTEDFVHKYIGKTILEEYKTTEIYTSVRDYFANSEKKTEAVFSVVKHQYINTQKYEEISKQFHLMSEYDVIATIITHICGKIVTVYCSNGLPMYFTDRNSNRRKREWSSQQFQGFEKASSPYNQHFDEAFISVFYCNNEVYFAEHNEPLRADEIGVIKTALLRYESSI